MFDNIGEIPQSDPLGYFLTWTTYGSWLPGDDRGWTAKPGRFMAPAPPLAAHARESMTEPELRLTPEQRQIVEATVTEHCRIRKWHLHVVNCRSQHVHVVVTAPGIDPEDVLDQFKAWCTRRLKERQRSDRVKQVRLKWWTQSGSKRRLYGQASLDGAIRYVIEEQDDPARWEDS